MIPAVALAWLSELRGYNAVHCASAEQLDDEDVVTPSRDWLLLDT